MGELVTLATSSRRLTGAKHIYVGNHGVAIGPGGRGICTAGRMIHVGQVYFQIVYDLGWERVACESHH